MSVKIQPGVDFIYKLSTCEESDIQAMLIIGIIFSTHRDRITHLTEASVNVTIIGPGNGLPPTTRCLAIAHTNTDLIWYQLDH